MSPKETAAKAKEVIDKATALVEEAKRGVSLMIFKEVILPHLKEYGMVLKWAMGGVCAKDKYGEDIEDYDPRMKLLDEKMEEVLGSIDLINNDYHNLLWWVLCEQPGSAVNYKGEVVGYDEKLTNPSISERIPRFSELKRGDYLYLVDYDCGDIEKHVVDTVSINDEGMYDIHILTLNYTGATVEGTRTRSGVLFTNYKSAERSLNRLFHKLEAHFNFYYKPDPEEIMAELLA